MECLALIRSGTAVGHRFLRSLCGPVYDRFNVQPHLQWHPVLNGNWLRGMSCIHPHAFTIALALTMPSIHSTALARSGRCAGPPGLRSRYHADGYSAYFRDNRGHQLAVACHPPE